MLKSNLIPYDPLVRALWRIGGLRKSAPPFYIAGAPRSGTTWALETLEHALNARRHYEPIAGLELSLALRGRDYRNRRPFVADSNRLPDLEEFIRNVLEEDAAPDQRTRMYNPNLGYLGSAKRIATANLTIPKFTKAQRLLPWMARTFNNPGLVIIRNPLSIIASSKAMRGPSGCQWAKERTLVKIDGYWREKFPKLSFYAHREMTRLQAMTVDICMDILVPVEDEYCRRQLVFATYEGLSQQPEKFGRIIELSGLEALMGQRQFMNRPSATTGKDSNVFLGKNPNLSWKNRLSATEVESVLEIMERVGIDFYDDRCGAKLELLRKRPFEKLVC